MSESEDFGRGHRKPKKTPGMLEFNQNIAKSKASVETRKRNKKVRRELEQLEEDEDERMSDPPPPPSPSKPKPNPKKTTAQPASKEAGVASMSKGEAKAAADEEAANVGEILDYEGQVDDLICKIYALKRQPMSKLRTLDLDELEALYSKLEAAQSTQVPKAAAKPSKPPAKQTGKGATALPATTPRKVASTKIVNLGSPIVAVHKAQERAVRAAEKAQDTKKRQRNDSVDLEDVRRPRLESKEPQRSGASTAVAAPPPGSRRPQSSGPSGSASSTRANSLAPTITSTQSKPSTYSGHDSADFEGYQVAMNGIDQAGDTNLRQGQGETTVPPAKKRKPRVTKGTFKGTVYEKLIDFAVPHTGALLAGNMCPDPSDYNLAIADSWDAALEYYSLSHNTHAMNADHSRVIKQLFSASRSRFRKRLADGIASEYNLHLSRVNTIPIVKQRAAELLPTAFHRDPDAIGENAGHYRHSFIARAFALVWLSGNNAPGKLYPELLRPVPITAIAYLCGLMEDIINRFIKDGYIKLEKKAKKGEADIEAEGKGKGKGKPKKKGKGQATKDGSDGEGSDVDSEDDDFTRAMVDDVKAPMLRHLKGLKSFRSVLKRKFKKYQKSLYDTALECVGPAIDGEPKAEPDTHGLGDEAFADEVDSGSESDESDESDNEPPQPDPRRARPAIPCASLHASNRNPTPAPRRATSSRPTPLSPVPVRQTGKPVARRNGLEPGLDAEGNGEVPEEEQDEQGEENEEEETGKGGEDPALKPFEDEQDDEEEAGEEEPAPKAYRGNKGESSRKLAATETPFSTKVAVVSSQSKRRYRPLFEEDDEAWPKEDLEDAELNKVGDHDRPAEVSDGGPMELDDEGPAIGQPSGLTAETSGAVDATGRDSTTSGCVDRSESPLSSPPPALPTKRKAATTTKTAPTTDLPNDDADTPDARMRRGVDKLVLDRTVKSKQAAEKQKLAEAQQLADDRELAEAQKEADDSKPPGRRGTGESRGRGRGRGAGSGPPSGPAVGTRRHK
ncbi:hypothetical protein RhiJN_06939 [Ceratobasidium sp. AG-Ba]|nr:hypothetical protein RhiJN_06939 [Ceratobasidium sp. AG-Ba]